MLLLQCCVMDGISQLGILATVSGRTLGDMNIIIVTHILDSSFDLVFFILSNIVILYPYGDFPYKGSDFQTNKA